MTTQKLTKAIGDWVEARISLAQLEIQNAPLGQKGRSFNALRNGNIQAAKTRVYDAGANAIKVAQQVDQVIVGLGQDNQLLRKQIEKLSRGR